MSELEVMPPKVPVVISFAVRPEEIELAFATNGESLRQRALLALVAELVTYRISAAASTSRGRKRNRAASPNA
jgi:hypothetical protein